MRLLRRRRESYEAMRRRMIRETEAALLFGLTHPEKMPRIPTIEVGRGAFDRRFAAAFWSNVLDLDADHPPT